MPNPLFFANSTGSREVEESMAFTPAVRHVFRLPFVPGTFQTLPADIANQLIPMLNAILVSAYEEYIPGPAVYFGMSCVINVGSVFELVAILVCSFRLFVF